MHICKRRLRIPKLGDSGFYPNSTETQILIAAIAIKTANARLSFKTGTLRLTRLPTRARGGLADKPGHR